MGGNKNISNTFAACVADTDNTVSDCIEAKKEGEFEKTNSNSQQPSEEVPVEAGPSVVEQNLEILKDIKDFIDRAEEDPSSVNPTHYVKAVELVLESEQLGYMDTCEILKFFEGEQDTMEAIFDASTDKGFLAAALEVGRAMKELEHFQYTESAACTPIVPK